jgi:6-phosphogluconolactonase
LSQDVELVIEEDEQGIARTVGGFLVDPPGSNLAVSGDDEALPAYYAATDLKPDWSWAAIWWTDELCLPHDDRHTNYQRVGSTFLARMQKGPMVVHSIFGHLGPCEAVWDYKIELGSTIPDLALLVVRRDGSTAGLYPDSPALQDEGPVTAVDRGSAARITLTPSFLSRAPLVVFLATGWDAASAVKGAFVAPPSPKAPASLIRSRSGRTVAVIDRAAASLLDG